MTEPKIYCFEIPPSWFRSPSVVAIEHLIIRKYVKSCPNCGSKEVKFFSQMLLEDKERNSPFGGDLITYKCQKCNAEIIFFFRFAYPSTVEGIFYNFSVVYDCLLESFIKGDVPDYLSFSKYIRPILSDLKMRSQEAFKLALNKIAEDIKKFLNSSSDNDAKKLKLLLALVSLLPEEDFNFVKEKVGSQHEKMLEDIRKNFERGLKRV